MKNTMLFHSAKKQCDKAQLLAVALLMATLSLTTLAPKARAQVVVLPNETLANTWLASNAGPPVNANCAIAGCIAFAPLFPVLPVVCPGAVGATCTFYIHLETDDTLSIGDKGRFQFLVGGLPPAPGPTQGAGFFIWDNNDPNSALATPFSHSYAVAAQVTNAAVNQAWPIAVSVSCVDNPGTPAGCAAVTKLANLDVIVFVP